MTMTRDPSRDVQVVRCRRLGTKHRAGPLAGGEKIEPAQQSIQGWCFQWDARALGIRRLRRKKVPFSSLFSLRSVSAWNIPIRVTLTVAARYHDEVTP